MDIKIMIVDDHALLREGLGKILSLESEFKIVGEACHGEEAIVMARLLKPNVILMDINMPGVNGIEATKVIKSEMPEIGVIGLTIHEDEEYVFELVRAGVSGYFLKDVQPDQLIKSIKEVALGKTALQADITSKLMEEFNRLSNSKNKATGHETLTARELEVLKIIAKGRPNKDISKELFISEKTVKNHITNIFRKLQVEDRTQAALFAVKHKIVDL